MRGKSMEAHTQKSFPSASVILYEAEESRVNYKAKIKVLPIHKTICQIRSPSLRDEKWI